MIIVSFVHAIIELGNELPISTITEYLRTREGGAELFMLPQKRLF